jgi:hypothetical protein
MPASLEQFEPHHEKNWMADVRTYDEAAREFVPFAFPKSCLDTRQRCAKARQKGIYIGESSTTVSRNHETVLQIWKFGRLRLVDFNSRITETRDRPPIDFFGDKI